MSFSALVFHGVCVCDQLLMPHIRRSLQINLQARGSLLAAGGVFDKVHYTWNRRITEGDAQTDVLQIINSYVTLIPPGHCLWTEGHVCYPGPGI